MSSDMSDDGDDDAGGGGGAPFSAQVLDNVLESVLQFLTSRGDRSAASLVCRSWYHAEARTRRHLFIGNCYAVSPSRAIARFTDVRSLVLKGRPRFAHFKIVPLGWGAAFFSPWASAISSSYPRLERICLKRMTVADDDLLLISRSFPDFRDLVLISCDGFGTAGLASVAHNCRNLRVLDLIKNDVEDEVDEGVDWISRFPETGTRLESLVFYCCPVNLEALVALVSRSPCLRQLRVNPNVTITQLLRLMAQAPQLTHLGTGSFRMADVWEHQNDLGSVFASNSRSLVGLSGFCYISPEYLPLIYPACANLTSLDFSDAQISAEQLSPVILRCHNLQTLWVLDTVRDEGLQAVAGTCKDLRELRVFPSEYSEDSVSDTGLAAISQGCPKLRYILYCCQEMTNAAVIAMSNNCQELEVFRLCITGRHRPDALTGKPMDKGFGAIVKNCKKLKRLAVSGLLTTEKAFEYIGKHGKLIRTLSVAFAGDSDLSLSYVLEGCPKLQKLEIRDSPYGDSGLLSGIHHYYNMRFICMSSCNLSLRGCKAVAQRMPQLVVEVIRDRPNNDEDQAIEKLYMYLSLAAWQDQGMKRLLL